MQEAYLAAAAAAAAAAADDGGLTLLLSSGWCTTFLCMNTNTVYSACARLTLNVVPVPYLIISLSHVADVNMNVNQSARPWTIGPYRNLKLFVI